VSLVVEEVPEVREIPYVRPRLYPKQEAALFAPERYGIVEASTKSGKTVGCIVWLHEKAALEGGPNRHYWWIAPIRRMARIAFRRLKVYLPRGSFTANETDSSITLRNGSVITFLGAENPDSLYGEDVYAAVIDEATRVKAESWYAIRSTLTATGGPVRIIGNVKGRRNWAYKLARRAEMGLPGYHYAKLTVWDAVAAGIFDESEAFDAKGALPDAVFRELYLAEPAEGDEAFFDIGAIAVVADYPRHARVARAWDLAASEPKPGTDPDYTVGAKLAFDDNHTYVVDIVRFRGSSDRAIDVIIRTAVEDGRVCDQLFEEEKGASGKTLIAQFKRMFAEIDGAGRVFPASVTGGKIARAYHLAAAANDKRLSLVEADWNEPFLGLLDDFPEGDKDDDVDAVAHAFNYLVPNLKPNVRWI